MRAPLPAPERRVCRAAARARADRAPQPPPRPARPRPRGRGDGRAARLLPARGRRRAGVQRGDTVAIVGLGPIGLMLCACVADAGGRPVGVGWRPERRALAPLVRRRTGDAEGADVVIEAAGTVEAWERALALVRPGGTVLAFGGLPRGTRVAVDPYRIHYEEVPLARRVPPHPAPLPRSARVPRERRVPVRAARDAPGRARRCRRAPRRPAARLPEGRGHARDLRRGRSNRALLASQLLLARSADPDRAGARAGRRSPRPNTLASPYIGSGRCSRASSSAISRVALERSACRAGDAPALRRSTIVWPRELLALRSPGSARHGSSGGSATLGREREAREPRRSSPASSRRRARRSHLAPRRRSMRCSGRRGGRSGPGASVELVRVAAVRDLGPATGGSLPTSRRSGWGL